MRYDERELLAEEALKAEAKASELLSGLCNGSHRFTMSVPARPTEDTDLVIGEALAYIPKLAAALRAAWTPGDWLITGVKGEPGREHIQSTAGGEHDGTD